MPKKSVSLEQIFIDLTKSEAQPMSHGIPRLKSANDAVDQEYLKYKLRLYTRYLSYSSVLEAEFVDLEWADFGEIRALVERRPELLGMCPVCATLWRVIKLQQSNYATVDKAELSRVLNYLDEYSTYFTREEHKEVIELLINFTTRVGTEGQPAFVEESKLMFLRSAIAEFGGAPKAGRGVFLKENSFQAAISLLLNSSLHLRELSFMATDEESVTSVEEWVLEFSRRYNRFLPPAVRKEYVRLVKLAVMFYQENYYEGIRIATKLTIRGNDPMNLFIKRLLFKFVFSITFYGSGRERRLLRKMNLSAELVLERMRKHLDYVKAERPQSVKNHQYNQKMLFAFRKLHQLYKMKERFPLSAAERTTYQQVKDDLAAEDFSYSPMMKKWTVEQIARLGNEQ